MMQRQHEYKGERLIGFIQFKLLLIIILKWIEFQNLKFFIITFVNSVSKSNVTLVSTYFFNSLSHLILPNIVVQTHFMNSFYIENTDPCLQVGTAQIV